MRTLISFHSKPLSPYWLMTRVSGYFGGRMIISKHKGLLKNAQRRLRAARLSRCSGLAISCTRPDGET